jgi:hypothetical protein
MLKGETYKNTNDLSKIQFIETITHYTKPDGKQGLKKVKLEEPILNFKYIESIVKKGEVSFKESEFERLVKQGMFVKI